MSRLDQQPECLIEDPLPKKKILEDVSMGGLVKSLPEDFTVEEVPLYEPCGDGEHLYLWVRKYNMPHTEMRSILQSHFGVGPKCFGAAGMKDKVAVTTQMVSIHLPGGPFEYPPLEHDRLQILGSNRHLNKLRRGHLKGNRFHIRVRQVDPVKVTTVAARLKKLEQVGIPDYYGYQRFGYRRNNHVLGCHLANGRFESLVRELLGATGSSYPEQQEDVRRLFDAGDYAAALDGWSSRNQAERAVLRGLIRGDDWESSVMSIEHHTLRFWQSALQSAIFNDVLDKRIDEGQLASLVEGDIAWNVVDKSLTRITAEHLASGDLEQKVRNLDLTATGPMYGPKMLSPTGRPGLIEAESVLRGGIDDGTFQHGIFKDNGVRRPFRMIIRDTSISAGVDKHGGYISVCFELPKGGYATVVLEELLGSGLVMGQG